MMMFFCSLHFEPQATSTASEPKKGPDPKEFIGSSESVACIDLFSFLRKYSDVALMFL